MASSKRCSACEKELGPMYCTGCEKYFCWKDFTTHREGMFTVIDKIVEERNRLQDAINNEIQHSDQPNPLIEEINQWQKSTIKKIELVAAQARAQATELLNAKRVKINIEFKSFSQELARLRESKNYVEHDLTRLNQMISQFKKDLRQSAQAPTIVLHTEKSDGINWESLLYVEERQATVVVGKLVNFFF
jgi:hypothetical protein